MTIEEEAAQATQDIPQWVPPEVPDEERVVPMSERARNRLKTQTLRLRRTEMRTTLPCGRTVDVPGAVSFTPRPESLLPALVAAETPVVAERAATSDELRAAMRAAIDRQTAKRSTSEAVRQAEAAIRADCAERVYDTADIRTLLRLRLLR